jgi:hypothetical protein
MAEVHPNDQWELEPRVEELESMVEVRPKEQWEQVVELLIERPRYWKTEEE